MLGGDEVEVEEENDKGGGPATWPAVEVRSCAERYRKIGGPLRPQLNMCCAPSFDVRPAPDCRNS